MRTTTSWIASGALLALLKGLAGCYPGIRTGATAPRTQAAAGGTSPTSIARPPTAARRVVPAAPPMAARVDAGSSSLPAGVRAAPARCRQPGFVVLENGRLWMFRAGSEALAEYRTSGDPAKRVTRIGAGPDGRTITAPDNEPRDGYLTAAGQGR